MQAEKTAKAVREMQEQAHGVKPTLYLTAQQHLDSLRRLRHFITPSPNTGRLTGGELVAGDCDEEGDKETECSWGQCTGRPEQWPPDTRLWPERALTHDGRVYGVKYHQAGQFCPFDRRAPEGDPMHGDPGGCFYRCRIFKPTKDEPVPTREEALVLFDETIEEYRTEGYKLTAADEEQRTKFMAEPPR
jgi:hypothetical protein